VAVFELELRNVELKASMARILRDYLSDRLAATGKFRVVPGDKTRSALTREQRRTRQLCFEKSCQIRIGRALAADRTLSTRVMHIGKRCTLSATLYDLATQVTERGATAKSGCSEEELQLAIEEVVHKLASQSKASRQAGGSGPAPTVTRPVVQGAIAMDLPESSRITARCPRGMSSSRAGIPSWKYQ